MVGYVMYRMVEGVSRVKKCTTAGRGLMAMDVTAVYSVATRVLLPSTLEHDKAYADEYIKAFYFESEGDVMQWVLKNKVRFFARSSHLVGGLPILAPIALHKESALLSLVTTASSSELSCQ